MTSKSRQRELARQKARRQAQRREEQRRRRQRLAVGGAIAAAVLIGGGILVALAPWESDSTDSTAAQTSDTDSTGSDESAEPGDVQPVSCSYPPSQVPAAREVGFPPESDVPATGTEQVTLDLGQGPVTILLDRTQAPCTVNSFVYLAEAGYFDDTVCHRLTTGENLSVLQCGDPTGTGSGGPGYTFADETSPDMRYTARTVAMANSGPDSNGSQFFLVYADSVLPPSYTTFGLVSEGMDVLTDIGAAGTADGSEDGAPREEVRISSVVAEPVQEQ